MKNWKKNLKEAAVFLIDIIIVLVLIDAIAINPIATAVLIAFIGVKLLTTLFDALQKIRNSKQTQKAIALPK